MPKHSVSVAVIVRNADGRVLVVKRRDNGHWEPPGGVLELGETPQEGARREVLEETGIEVEVLTLSGVYKNLTRGVVSLVFHGKKVAGNPHPTAESTEVEWVEIENALRSMAPAYAVRVEDALAEGVAVRSHDGYRVLR